jgi:chromate transporter
MIYLTLFWTFFEIGAFTFGGGYAMLPLIQAQVEAHGWLTSRELVDFIAVSESTPGPFAVNVSTYVGAQTGGVFGAFCATLGVILPSFIVILLVARCFTKFQDNRFVKGGMSGLKPAVVGLIGAAVISTGKTVFFPAEISPAACLSFAFLSSLAIFAGMMVLSLKKMHPILIIVISAACGIAAGYLQKYV